MYNDLIYIIDIVIDADLPYYGLDPAATSFWTVAYLAIFTFNKEFVYGEKLDERVV